MFPEIDEFQSAEEAFFWFGATSGGIDIQKASALLNCLIKWRSVLGPISPKHVLVFDTETTGISKSDVVIQFACVLLREDGSTQMSYNELWRQPKQEKIKNEAFCVHKISQNMINAKGKDPTKELEFVKKIFMTCIQSNVKLVAHNAQFDVRLLSQTAHSANASFWNLTREQVFCTQKHGRGNVKVFDKIGRLKAPSNTELYFHFHNCFPTENLHDALNDCKVTGASYLAGRNHGWWT